jgi:hypothetical protein
MIDETEEKIYQKIKKEKQKKLGIELFKSFGATLIIFYIMFSSFILGQVFSFLYLFVFNDMKDIMINYFGEYTIIVSYGLLSSAFSFILFYISILGLELYYKSQSLINNDEKR